MVVEGFSNASDFLGNLVGKPIEVVLLVSRDWRGADVLTGTLTRVYANAILLSRQNREQLIYLHAVAMIQETDAGGQAFHANIATVPGSTAGLRENEVPAQYIGE